MPVAQVIYFIIITIVFIGFLNSFNLFNLKQRSRLYKKVRLLIGVFKIQNKRWLKSITQVIKQSKDNFNFPLLLRQIAEQKIPTTYTMHKYQILDIIDEGAYGIVWKAVKKQTQQLVAIKEFKQSDEDQTTKKTIQRQIKMLKMLKSDYVVEIKQAFKKKQKIYLIFEFFPSNLLNLIEIDNQGLNPKIIQFIVYKIVKCLKFLHQKNVIHRDIKPENILLSDDNQVLKLCDFGFARFIPENIREMTDYVATRWYRSPQLLVGEPYQKPSDIFALGCIIGELVDGQPMFPGEDQVDQLYQLRKTLGELTPQQEQYMRKNEKFKGVIFPEVKKRQPLEQKYLGKIQKNALSFMKLCLKMNANERITVEQALKHPYLIQLSHKNKDFQNDEQNLLQNGRKTVAKHQMRGSIISDIQDDNQSHYIEDSVYQSKTKSITKVQSQKLSKANYGSVDYTSINKIKNLSQYNNTNNKILLKKSSQQIFINQVSPPKQIKQQKSKKLLKKNMSEQKNIKLNFDVNVNINLKFNKKIESQNFYKDPKKFLQYQKDSVNNELKKNKLPQLKPKGFLNRKKDDLLFGIGKRIGQRNNLSINGQSKEITKTLIGKKLQGISVH